MAVVGLAVVVAIAGSCGGSEPSATTTTATTTTARPTTPTTTTPSVATTGPTDERQSTLDAAREVSGAPGALAFVRLDGAEWHGASGAADLAGTVLVPETRFRVASITKPIVAALTLNAVQRGELSLDAVVGEMVPGVVRPDPPITVQMLLNHTSGVFDAGNESDPLADIELLTDPALQDEAHSLVESYTAGGADIASDRLFVALAEVHERYFDPGAGFHYSNANYQLAAMVLEEVTGRPLTELLTERVVDPLGLQHTTIAPPDTDSPEFRGYGRSDDGSLLDVTDHLIAFGNGGSGGIITTADELLTMIQAIAAGKIVAGGLLDEMKTPTAQSDRSYGLGLATYHLSCGTFLGHEGVVNGTASIAIVSPDGADGVVVALNLRSGGDPHLPQVADELLCGDGDK